MSRGGKRMVMWSSDSRRHRTCTPDSFARVERSTPIRPQATPPHHQTAGAGGVGDEVEEVGLPTAWVALELDGGAGAGAGEGVDGCDERALLR